MFIITFSLFAKAVILHIPLCLPKQISREINFISFINEGFKMIFISLLGFSLRVILECIFTDYSPKIFARQGRQAPFIQENNAGTFCQFSSF